jgi:hypothetical protein
VDVIEAPFRNTADDSAAQESHYEKFSMIRGGELPSTYPVKDPSGYTADDHKRREILMNNFASFTALLGELFAGKSPAGFEPLMVTVGANVLACWKSGVTPQFS